MKYHVLTLLALLCTLTLAKKPLNLNAEERVEADKKILEVDLPKLRQAKIDEWIGKGEENPEDKVAPIPNPEGPVGRVHYDWAISHVPAGAFMSYVQVFTQIELLFTPEETETKRAERYATKLEKYGELLAKIDACYEQENGNDPEKLWVDRHWQSSGVYHLDVENWDKYIATNKKGDKPWLIVFGTTPYGFPRGNFQTTEVMLSKLACIAKYDEDYNVGFADYGVDELVWESIDHTARKHGQMAPYVILVKDGKVHHSRQINYQTHTIYEKFLHNITSSSYVEPVRKARTSDTLYVEYTLRELSKWKQISKNYNKVSKYINALEEEGKAEWYHLKFRDEFMFPLLGNQIPDKQAGRNLIKFVYLPALILAYITFRIFFAILRALLCSKKEAEKTKTA